MNVISFHHLNKKNKNKWNIFNTNSLSPHSLITRRVNSSAKSEIYNFYNYGQHYQLRNKKKKNHLIQSQKSSAHSPITITTRVAVRLFSATQT